MCSFIGGVSTIFKARVNLRRPPKMNIHPGIVKYKKPAGLEKSWLEIEFELI
jgi:hypothetical protein